MVLYKSKDICVGLKIEINKVPYIVLESNFVNPGKGQAFNKLKLKNILTNTVIIKTVKIGEKLKSADLFFLDANFLYNDNFIYYFIDPKTSDYYEINLDIIGKKKIWIKEDLLYSIVLWNNNVIAIKIPRFIELKVISTEIIVKGSIIAKNFKYSKLENGFNFKVPNFIKENDIIKIDTEKGIYVSRIV